MLRTAIAGFVGVWVGAAVVGVAAGQGKQAKETVVRAERFEVLDDDGAVRMVLTAPVLGDPALIMNDEDGNMRLMLALGDGEPMVVLTGADGELRATMSCQPDGSAALMLCDTEERARASLTLLPDGRPSLTMLDDDARARAIVGAASSEMTPSGAIPDRPEASVVLLDEEEKAVWSAP